MRRPPARASRPEANEEVSSGEVKEPRRHRRWWYLLFVVQFIAVLWPGLYNSDQPRWMEIPFFYWYQLLWVVISAILTAIVYFVTA
jgi:hypothetical protein